MSDEVKWDGLNQDFLDLKRKLFAFGETIGREAFERCESGVLSDADAGELKYGTHHVLEGLNELIRDADLLIAVAPDTFPLVLGIVGHARALIGGALYVGKHLEVTETAKALTQKAQTEAAVQRKKDKKNERAEQARDIIEAAERSPKDRHKLADYKTVWVAVSRRLKMPQLDRKTLMSYVAYIDETGKNVVPPV